MGKKNKDKVKEKKAAHKAQLAQLSASQSRITAANALQDPLAPFSLFQKYNKNDIQVSMCINEWILLCMRRTLLDLTCRY